MIIEQLPPKTGKLSLTKTLVSLAWQPAPMCHDKVALYSLQPKSEIKVYYHPPCTILKMLLSFTALITMAPMSLFLLFYAYGCFACMSLCTTCAHGPHRGQKSVQSPRTGITDGCEPLCGCWEWKPGPLGVASAPRHAAVFPSQDSYCLWLHRCSGCCSYGSSPICQHGLEFSLMM